MEEYSAGDVIILAERPPLAGNDKGVKNITMPTNSFLPFYRLLLMCFYLYFNYGDNMIKICFFNDE